MTIEQDFDSRELDEPISITLAIDAELCDKRTAGDEKSGDSERREDAKMLDSWPIRSF